jgi:hypothetical protein
MVDWFISDWLVGSLVIGSVPSGNNTSLQLATRNK